MLKRWLAHWPWMVAAIFIIGAGLFAQWWLAKNHHQTTLLLLETGRNELRAGLLEQKKRQLEATFRIMYESARTISLLPSVRKISGGNRRTEHEDVVAQGRFSGDAALTVQQVYNNLASNLAVSEVYSVIKGFQPEKGEVPFFMYDQLIVDAARRDGESSASKDSDVPEEDETEEYQQYGLQLRHLEQKYPEFRYSEAIDQIPVVASQVIRTCDNSQYTSIRTGQVKNAEGLLYSVPFYGMDNQFKGLISVVVRTNVLEALLLDLPFIPVTPDDLARLGAERRPYPEQAGRFFLVSERYGIAIKDRRSPYHPDLSEEAVHDPDLLITEVSTRDDAGWKLAYRIDPAHDIPQLKDENRLYQTRLIGVRLATGVLLLVVFAIMLTRQRHEARLNHFAVRIESFANGHSRLADRVSERLFRGQLRQVAFFFNQFLQALSSIVAQVRQNSFGLNDSAAQVSQTARELSQLASRQAVSVQEATDRAGEMETMAQMALAASQRACSAMQDSFRDVEKGRGSVGTTLQAMRDISHRMAVIEDLARQTNLLALNASVEAARAGEHGKGFAIVAQGVRTLADRSHEVARQIQEAVRATLSQAEQTEGLMTGVLPQVEEAVAHGEKISAQVSRQAELLTRMKHLMADLNRVAQNNASASEQLAATSVQLSDQSRQLNQLMDFFGENAGRQ